MAETKNTEKQNIEIQKEEEKEKMESVRKADAAVKSMHDFTSPEVLYQELIKSVKKYHPSTDISMIEKAYKVASEAHKDQKRKSGEPYIIHPICVAIILAELELDKESIIAGLLHDVVGIENLCCDSEYDHTNLKDENHRWQAITFNHVKDGWVRRVEAHYFANILSKIK